MYRMASLMSGLMLCTSIAFAQEPQLKAEIPEDAFSTRPLVAWSSLQKPQPAPQPLPPRDTPIPQPDPPPDQQSKSPDNPQQQQSPVQSFTGKIVKQGAEYVLKGTTTYMLDQQSDASQYENKEVKVTGNLDTTSNRIHVVKIELLS